MRMLGSMVLWLVALVGLVQAASAEVTCEQWLQASPLKKHQVIVQSLESNKPARSDAVHERCLNEAARGMQTEIDAACRHGQALRTVFAESGLAWSITCSVVMARSTQGERVTLSERKQIRSDWDACVKREGDPSPCREELFQRYITDRGASDASECGAYSKLPEPSRVNEARDRIQVRFSVSMELAQCLDRDAAKIAEEVREGCRDGRPVDAIWDEVLQAHTDHCLQRDVGY
jgi:hypothetical protein